jgi:PAS domain S-box-containing protein
MHRFPSLVPIGKARISAAVEVNRKNTLGGDLLSSALCLGAIAIGITALTGYVLGKASIAALGTNGKPVAAVALIVLGAGLLALRSFLHKRASESARLASIVDSSDDAIIGQSREGVIESWNAGAERMYGYSAAEAIGRSIAVLAPPGQQDEIPLLLERLRRGGRVDSFETVRVARDGRRVDVLLSVSPVVDHTGNMVGASTIAHDVTSRKSDEGVIRRMAEQHAVLLATSTDGFWLADLDGLLLDVNEAYCRMSGYSREELLGMTLHDLEAFETPEETAGHIRNIVESGFDRFETKHRTKDNRIIDIEASVSPLRTTGQVLGFARDITLQKQEREALRSGEERLQLAQRAAGIGPFSWDIQNNILTPSDELLALYGLRPGSFSGRYESWRALMFPDDLAAVDAEMKKSLTSGEFSCDFRVVWPDASIHWMHSRAKVFFSDDGKPLRALGVNMDITERMRIEKEMRSKTALLEAQLNATTDGILIVDENGKKIIQNPRLTELWKIPGQVAENHDDRQQIEFVKNRTRDPEQFVGKVLYLYSHPNETSHDEVAFKDGTILDRYSAPVIGNDGTHFGRVWVFRDITEKKLAEERIEKAMADLEGSNRNLEKGEAALKEAQRAAHVGHWAWSAVTGTAVWSDEFYRILGIPVGSAPPSFELYLSLVDPADRRILEEEMARMVDSGEGGADRDLDFDARITTQTGVSRILAQRVMADRDASGSVVGFHGTIQDITRRVATEQALRDSEVALAEAQQIAHIGSWIFHPQSGEASVSAETFRIFGIDPRPVVRFNEFLELVHEEDRAAVAARSTASVGTGRLDVEFRIATARGERVVRAVARQRETGDSPFSLIGTIQDITDQKAAEEALRQHSESLQRSNAELDRFNRAAVGRELRMIELKQQINDLYAQSGRPAPYVLPQEHALARETA